MKKYKKESNKPKVIAEESPLLEGYDLMPKENWSGIQLQSHIRYKRLDTGELRKGGYLVNISNTQDQDNNNTIKFDLVSNFRPDAVKWSIYATSIEKIWVRQEMPSELSIDLTATQNEIKNIKEQIEMLKKVIQKINTDLQNRFQKIEDEQMRTVMLIKKLHKI